MHALVRAALWIIARVNYFYLEVSLVVKLLGLVKKYMLELFSF